MAMGSIRKSGAARARWGAVAALVVVSIVLVMRMYELRAAAASTTHASEGPLAVLGLAQCVVETCNDDWSAANGAGDVNVDAGGCATVRNMVRMSDLKANITGHWCKAWRAVQRCEDRRYRYFIFRDDDTRFDVHRLLSIALRSKAPVIASYKYRTRHIVTNWFLLDTHSHGACQNMRKWWAMARRHHPEHDQKYFNLLFKCGENGVLCLDKRVNILREVHCRSSLGPYRATARQACLRYQVQPRPHLL